MQVAGVDDGAAGVGVGGREDLDAGASLDVGERRAHGGVLEDGVEDDVRSAESIGAGGGRAGGRDAHDDGVRAGVDGLDEGASDDVRAGHGHAGVDAGRAGDGIERDGRRTEDDGVGGGTREVLRGGIVAVDDQFGQRGSEDAADGGGADGDRTVVRAAEDATEAEGEDVRRRGESQLVMRVARETQDGGRGRAGGEGRDGVGAVGGQDVRLSDELGELTRAEVGVVAGETAVPDDAHAGDRVVGRVVFVIGDGPSSDETARSRDEGGVEDDAGGELRLTETAGADEVDGGAGGAGEARGQEVGAPEDTTGSRDTDVTVALEQAERAEAFRIVGVDQAVEEERAAVERDRGGVVDAIQQLDVGVVVVVDLESSVGDVDRGGIAELGLVSQVETVAADVGRAAVGLERAERQGTRTGHGGEADVGALDGTVEAEVILADHEGGGGGGRIRDDAAGARLGAEGAETARVEEVAVEVQRTVALDVEDVTRPAEERVITCGELERAFQDRRLAAVILLGRDQERARADLDDVGIRDDRALEIERGVAGDVEITRRVGGEDVAGARRGGVVIDTEAGPVDDLRDETVAGNIGSADDLTDGETGGVADADDVAGRQGRHRRRGHDDEIETGSGQDVRDAARGEDAARGDGQVSGRAGGADIAGGRVGDGETAQGAVEGDVIGTEAGIDAQDVAEGGRADVGGGGIARELDDTVGGVVSAELAVADEELGLEAGRQAVEEQLTGYAEVGRASDVQSAARIGEERVIKGREGERRSASRLGDLGVTVEASWTGELIGAGAGGDVVESAARHREGRGIPESGRQGVDAVIDGHRAAAEDEQAVTDGGVEGVERARAGDGRRTALHLERGDGIGPGEVELARAAMVDLAGRGSAAVDHGAGEVRGAGAAGHEDTSGTVVRDIESTEIKGGAAGQVVEDPAVGTRVDRRAIEGKGLAATEGDGVTVEDDAAGTIRAGKGLGHRGLDATAIELQAFAGAEGGGLGETQGALLKDRVAGIGVRRTGHLEVGIGCDRETHFRPGSARAA